MARKLANLDDEYQCALDTAKAVRSGNWQAIDRKALLNELECSIAGGIRRRLTSILRRIIESLLVIDYTTAERRESDLQLVRAQGQLQLLLYTTPSLRKVVARDINAAYQQAKRYVTEDYGISFPERCPISLERIIEDPYPRVMAEAARRA